MATLLTPYTHVLFAAGGVVVGGLILMAALQRRPQFSVALALAVVALLAVSLLPQLWSGAYNFRVARASLRAPGAEVRHERCFIDRHRSGQLPFMRWLRDRIPERDSFGINSRIIDRTCLQLNVFPRQLVRAAARPRWTVVAGPFTADLRRRIELERKLSPLQRRVQIFADGYALIRMR